MAIVAEHGIPDLFITMTANPKWEEITELCTHYIDGNKIEQRSENRPDVVVRVFYAKLKVLLDQIKNKNIFGKAKAYVGTIEFQKRGLPHLHLLVFLDEKDKLRTAEEIESMMSAEIPEDESLQMIVKKFMVHGPCGEYNQDRKCMVNGKCRFKFPKEYFYI